MTTLERLSIINSMTNLIKDKKKLKLNEDVIIGARDIIHNQISILKLV